MVSETWRRSAMTWKSSSSATSRWMRHSWAFPLVVCWCAFQGIPPLPRKDGAWAGCCHQRARGRAHGSSCPASAARRASSCPCVSYRPCAAGARQARRHSPVCSLGARGCSWGSWRTAFGAATSGRRTQGRTVPVGRVRSLRWTRPQSFPLRLGALRWRFRFPDHLHASGSCSKVFRETLHIPRAVTTYLPWLRTVEEIPQRTSAAR
jgi:hypothetical protein